MQGSQSRWDALSLQYSVWGGCSEWCYLYCALQFSSNAGFRQHWWLHSLKIDRHLPLPLLHKYCSWYSSKSSYHSLFTAKFWLRLVVGGSWLLLILCLINWVSCLWFGSKGTKCNFSGGSFKCFYHKNTILWKVRNVFQFSVSSFICLCFCFPKPSSYLRFCAQHMVMF